MASPSLVISHWAFGRHSVVIQLSLDCPSSFDFGLWTAASFGCNCLLLTGLWQSVEVTIEEGIEELSSLCATEVIIGDVHVQTVPKPRERGNLLLKTANVTLPDAIPCRKVNVFTIKKVRVHRFRVERSGLRTRTVLKTRIAGKSALLCQNTSASSAFQSTTPWPSAPKTTPTRVTGFF